MNNHINFKYFMWGAFLGVLLYPLMLQAQSGGPYDLTWNTINSGGTASGGAYSLRGVIGQPDAGAATGGSYTLTGGFLQGPGCIVELDDLTNLVAQWLATGTGLAADFTGDNQVDLDDYGYLASYWMKNCPADWP